MRETQGKNLNSERQDDQATEFEFDVFSTGSSGIFDTFTAWDPEALPNAPAQRF